MKRKGFIMGEMSAVKKLMALDEKIRGYKL